MKTRYSLLASAMILTGSAVGMAFDADARSNRGIRKIPSWYANFTTSMSFVADSHITETDTTPQSGNVEFKDGYGISGAIGYRPRYTNSIWDNIRAEVELGVFDNDINSLTVIGGNIGGVAGDVQAQRLMANVFVDLDATKQIRPYIGGGIGGARIHLESDEDTVFAYQGMAGIYYTPSSFPVAEFGIGYRYFGTTNPTFIAASTNSLVEMEYDAHSIDLGMRVYF